MAVPTGVALIGLGISLWRDHGNTAFLLVWFGFIILALLMPAPTGAPRLLELQARLSIHRPLLVLVVSEPEAIREFKQPAGIFAA